MTSRLGRAILIGALCALVVFGVLRWRHGAGETSGTSEGNANAAIATSAGEPAADENTTDDAAPRGAIAGRVTDLAAQPIGGASVCVYIEIARPGLPDRLHPSCVTTGADGRYRVGELAPAMYVVEASAPKYQPARWHDGERSMNFVNLDAGATRESIDFALSPGGVEARGRVKDIGGGVVVGATVIVQSGEDTGSGMASVVTQSNAQGEWQVSVSAGQVNVQATASGYAPGWANGMAPGQFMEVSLTPESVLEGRVVEAGTETPLAGVRVAAGERPDFGFGFTSSENNVLTDAEGRFRIAGLQPGRYKPEATSARRWGIARDSVVLGLGETSGPVLIEVYPAASVSGRVQLADGHGCAAGGYVNLHDPDTGERRGAPTGGDGRVRIEGLSPGQYDVDVTCPSTVHEEKYEPVKLADQSVSGLVWKVNSGLGVRGVVVDSAGQPVAGASVFARAKGNEGPGMNGGGYGNTDKSGAFHMRGMVAGTYQLDVHRTGLATQKDPVEVKVDRDVDGVRIVVPAGGTIEGTVVDTKGAPVSAIEVLARAQTPSQQPFGPSGGQSSSRDDGTFVLEGLSPGDYRVTPMHGPAGPLRAAGPEGSDTVGTRVTVRAGEAARVKLVVESHRGEIQGRVVGEAGEPMSDVFVDATRDPEMKGGEKAPRAMQRGWHGGGGAPVLADLDGNFTVSKLAPGSYTVRAFRKGGSDCFAENVRVGSKVTLTMRAAGSLSGVVVSAAGSSPERFIVAAHDPKTGARRSEGFFRSGGTWTLRDLPAGTFDLSAETSEGRALGKVTLAQGEKRQGVRLTLEGNVKVRGQFVSLETGEPIAGMVAFIHPAKGESGGVVSSLTGRDAKRISDAAGRFEVERAPAGKVLFHASARQAGADYAFVFMPLTLDAGRTNELLPIRVPRSRVKGLPADLGFQTQDTVPDGDRSESPPHTVAVVRSGGPAAKAGLVVGDEIVSVDGYDVVGPNGYLFMSLCQVPEGTTVNLGLRRGSTIAIQGEKPLTK